MGYAVSKGNTTRPLYFLLVSSSDHITGATGAVPTVTLLKSGGAFASPAGAVSEVANGLYMVAAHASDADTIGPLFLHATATGCDPRDDEYEVLQDLTAASVALSPSSATTTALSASTLITGALKLIGALSQGETAQPEDLNDGLVRLNELIDGWGTERLMVPSTTRTVFTTSANVGSYTIGPGGNINQAWPQSIDEAGYLYLAGTSTVEIPMDVLTYDTYRTIPQKDQTNSLPYSLYYDHAYQSGLGTITLWPIPSTATDIAIYHRSVLSQFAGLSVTYAFPPGYAKALRYNLAVDLAPDYSKEPSNAVMRGAMESKANVKRANFVPLERECDPAVLQGSGGTGRWNIITGTTR